MVWPGLGFSIYAYCTYFRVRPWNPEPPNLFDPGVEAMTMIARDPPQRIMSHEQPYYIFHLINLNHR